MKVRRGFVSNSSSSSFIVKIDDLSNVQLLICRNYKDFVKFFSTHVNDCDCDCVFNFDYIDCVGGWSSYEEDGEIHFHTIMDNFDLCGFFEVLGIPIGDRDI